MQQPRDARSHTAVACAGAWMRSLPDGMRDWLIAHAETRFLYAGQRLFGRGDGPDGLYCVIEGRLRTVGLSASGQEAVLALVEPPLWLGEVALIDRAARTHDVWAETDATVWHVRQEPLELYLAEQPAGWRHVGRLLTHKLRLAFEMIEDTALLAPAQRVARRLADIAEGYGAWPGQSKRVVAISQEQLGLLLALSRQTVNQALRDLEAAGAIKRSRGAIEVVDLHRLRRGG